MAYKIYKKGAYIVIIDTVSGAQWELNSAQTQIKKSATTPDNYDILLNDVSKLKVNLADLQVEAGTAYSEAAWDTFRYEQTGSENSATIATSDLSLSGTLSVDTIDEFTADTGVTIDGALIKDAAFDTNVAAAGVTLSGTTLAADGTDANIDITLTPKGTGDVVTASVALSDGSVSDLAVKLGADKNNGIYGVSDTQLGVAVEGTLVAGFNTTGLFTDIISEQVGGNGVTIDGLLIKDGAVGNTAIVNIPVGVAATSGILGMGTVPIELLPAPAAGTYYDWEVRLEHTHVTTGYTLTGDIYVCGGLASYYGAYLSNWASGGSNQWVIMRPSPDFLGTVGADDYPTYSGQGLADSLVLTTLNGTDPTLGDGTWRAIITYTVRTFGA